MPIKQLAWKPYYVFKSQWFIWSKVINRTAQQLFLKHPPVLNELQQRVLKELRENGVATCSLTELFPERNVLAELNAYAKSLEVTAEVRTKKSFLRNYWGTDITLDFSNPFLRFALDPKVINLANSYMGMWTRLKHYTLNLTVPVPKEDKPKQSQRWHRDPQEKRMLKAFIYLNEVDDGAGPFTYVKKSTFGNKYGHLFPQRPPNGNYPPEGAVEKAVAKEDVRVMTAPAGTVIFCDTSGLHRGGYATERERLMFTAFYSAPSYKDPTWYKKGAMLSSPEAQKLSPEGLFALSE